MSEEELLRCLKHACDISCEKIREYDKYEAMHIAMNDQNSAAYYQYLSDAEWHKMTRISKIISEIEDLDH